jgi:UDP-N-acetyl-D-galactosamine dehydrogenase
MKSIVNSPQVVVVGLGYVGLPVAIALAGKFETLGYDVDSRRIAELRSGHDRTLEIAGDRLLASPLMLSDREADCAGADVYIITVPTPVDYRNRPDLTAVTEATRMVARVLDPAKRPTVIYESTVYPGVTEDICGAEIEKAGHVRGRDFRLGYSPERINPGDRAHAIDTITKVIAGEDDEVTEQMAELYGSITSGGVFRASSIKAAEAAKAIENAQRDINIAFVNEIAQILSNIGVSVWDVLAAARTKWNFLPFEPGLVGGHCIGVDPYYLSHLSQHFGHHPQVILAGRGTNDSMGRWIADALHEHRGRKPGRALVLGVTFKENVPDLRNSRVFDLVDRLRQLGHEVLVADPLAEPDELRAIHGLALTDLEGASADLVVAAVPHSAYRELPDDRITALLTPGGTLADIKGMWRDREFNGDFDRWSL